MKFLEQAAHLIFGTNADSYMIASSGQEVLPNLVLTEQHMESVRVTEQPVEIGAAITDHSFTEPARLQLGYYWTTSSIKGIVSDFTGELFSRGISNFSEAYVFNMYQKLVALKNNRYLCKVVTYKRVYENMVITDLKTVTDVENTYAMPIEITMQEIFMVKVGMSQNGVQHSGTKQVMNVNESPSF